jgi:Icc-related predicted phosphoesterase
MKILPMSDLHLEKPDNVRYTANLNNPGADALVLAGDTCSLPNRLVKTLAELSSRFTHLIFVTGNHEYYGNDRKVLHEKLKELCSKYSNIHWLNKSSVLLDGVTFFGGTLWFKPRPEDVLDHYSFTDFVYIPGFTEWGAQEYLAQITFLKTASPGSVIVTHHAPTHLSNDPQFLNSPINKYFVNNLGDLILDVKPALWIHGHVHYSSNYYLGEADESRILCNPLGYPFEALQRKRFNPKLIVEIAPVKTT